MKKIIIAFALCSFYAAIASAQVTPIADPCNKVYAPWGADKLTVMKEAANGKLLFNSVNTDGQSKSVYISYINGNGARMFTLHDEQYTTFSYLYMGTSEFSRTQFAAEQMNAYIPLAKKVADDGSIIIECNGTEFSVKISNNKSSVSVTVTNETLLNKIVSENVRAGR